MGCFSALRCLSIQSGRFSRDSYSAYLDLEADVTGAWLVSGALRYEAFGDFGDTTNGKLAARVEVSDRFALRAAAGTGFRAPSIGPSSLRRARRWIDCPVSYKSGAARWPDR